jgi:hypothetical protein
MPREAKPLTSKNGEDSPFNLMDGLSFSASPRPSRRRPDSTHGDICPHILILSWAALPPGAAPTPFLPFPGRIPGPPLDHGSAMLPAPSRLPPRRPGSPGQGRRGFDGLRAYQVVEPIFHYWLSYILNPWLSLGAPLPFPGTLAHRLPSPHDWLPCPAPAPPLGTVPLFPALEANPETGLHPPHTFMLRTDNFSKYYSEKY